jgi:hypothetical protein
VWWDLAGFLKYFQEQSQTTFKRLNAVESGPVNKMEQLPKCLRLISSVTPPSVKNGSPQNLTTGQVHTIREYIRSVSKREKLLFPTKSHQGAHDTKPHSFYKQGIRLYHLLSETIMAPCTCGDDMDGDGALALLLVFFVDAALEAIRSAASDACDCERCAAEEPDEEQDEELGLLLAKRWLRDIQDDDEGTRAMGISLLHFLLVEGNGPSLSSASKLALTSSDAFEILAEAVPDQHIPSSCTAKGIMIIMNMVQTDDDHSTFVDAMGGLQGLANWMEYHLDDAYICGLISNMLCRIVQNGLFDDEDFSWQSEGLVDLMVEALEMHLAISPFTFQMFICGIPAAWPVLRPYDRRIRDCIMEAMSSHCDNQDCQRSGEEVLTEISGLLEDLKYAVLEVAGEDNCSAAAA